MKVLLQNQKTKMFAQADGQWRFDEQNATDFKTPLDAMNFCQLHHLSDTSIVVWTEGKKHEMPLRCDQD